MQGLPREDTGELMAYMADGKAIAYQDRDGSTICVDCARRSDADPDEVPQFKPRSWRVVEPPDPDEGDPGLEYCESCSEPLDPRQLREA